MRSVSDMLQPIKWQEQQLHLLDQRLLPLKQVWVRYSEAEAVAEAIRDMVVRGAPAIGISAAYAVVLAARQAWESAGSRWQQAMDAPLKKLAASRPTAVNLRWAIEQMRAIYMALPAEQSPEAELLKAATNIHQQDIIANQTMARLGAELLAPDSVVLTHCNAGALATGGVGTALGVIRQAGIQGKIKHVYVDETRPWLQGARLTIWELMQEQIPCTLQADAAAAALMSSGEIDWVIVGADRITANGDVANKIGTYALAVLAKYHQVNLMVVAPMSTIDWQTESGQQIVIEQRPSTEVTHIGTTPLTADGVQVNNPAFDVTPAALITAIITEAGIVLSPSAATMKTLLTDH